MKYLLDEREFQEKMSQARAGGFEYAIALLARTHPELARSIADENLLSAHDLDGMGKLIDLIVQKGGGL